MSLEMSPELEAAIRAAAARCPAPAGKVNGSAVEPDLLDLVPLAASLVPAIERTRRRMSGLERPIPLAHAERAEQMGGGQWPGLDLLISGTGAGKSQLAIEDILAAAKAGVPIVYIGLELDAFQVALRFLAEDAEVSWSKLYLGRCSEYQLGLAQAAIDGLAELPIYTDFAGPGGWPLPRLTDLCEAMRRRHPDGPIKLCLDYLQLVAPATENGRRIELRERIGEAAFAAKCLSSRYDAAITMVSSTARGNYGLVTGDAVKAAGISMAPREGQFSKAKVVGNPDVLVGAGKEAGEIEATADSVTVLVRWPVPLDSGERVVLAVVAKGRATGAAWSAMIFAHGARFVPYAVNDMDDLPDLKCGRCGRPPEPVERYEKLVAEALARDPALKSARACCEAIRSAGYRADEKRVREAWRARQAPETGSVEPCSTT